MSKHIIIKTCVLLAVTGISSCKKLVSIPDPINTISTTQVFRTEAQANGAMAGIYTRMINGENPNFISQAAQNSFGAGLTTMLGGLSSDELISYIGPADPNLYAFNTNQLTTINSSPASSFWTSAYSLIYGANSVIEGISETESSSLRDSVKASLTGQAKFIRAFCYFYLTNFFGDVPLALTVNFNETVNLPRTPQQQVYQQIIQDLKDAQSSLGVEYTSANAERVKPNKWAATALLARVYLYLGDYQNAATEASSIIDNTTLFGLEADLNNVFLTTSREAIWQLQQTTMSDALKNATPEGIVLLPNPLLTGTAPFVLSDQLLSAFDSADTRLAKWADTTDNSGRTGVSEGITYHPNKYKTGTANGIFGAPATEYYMVFRLAEIYLIRAEAAANGAGGGATAAIADLNVIRTRAGVAELPGSLTTDELTAAVSKERQTELFAEWGHRWLDLKRTGRASTILSSIPIKQSWAGDYQLLYPIPVSEIKTDPFLIQNPGY